MTKLWSRHCIFVLVLQIWEAETQNVACLKRSEELRAEGMFEQEAS